jgi:hypothetical protein
LLWENKIVKKTLQKDHNILYNNLIKSEVKNKINQF